MAHNFTDLDIYAALAGNKDFTMYVFIDIMVKTPIYLTTFPSDVTIANASTGAASLYYSQWIQGVNPPARTGNVSQEIQRFTVAQGLGANFGDASLDFIRLLGDDFHNSMCYVRTLISTDEKGLIVNSPISRTEGLLKGITRSVNSNNVTIEFSNSFGKLNQVNELRTTSGSIKRRNSEDTCFDRCHIETEKHLVDWGIRPGGSNS